MNISILLPTRKRYKLLKQSLHSLIQSADNPDKIEILLAADNDDKHTISKYKKIRRKYRPFSIQMFVNKRHTYDKLYLLWNMLASKASGKWLMLWNDDTFMNTQSWDTIINQNTHEIAILDFCAKPKYSIAYPILSNRLFQITGAFSRFMFCDDWIVNLDKELKNTHNINITHQIGPFNFKHLGADLNDSTRKEVDKYAQKGRKNMRKHKKLYHKLCQEDANKVASYVKQQ